MANKQKIKFSISILAMNGLEMTRRCVDSVLAGGKNFELILTDNASDDGTADYFEELKTTAKVLVTVIHNTVNKGFSEPNTYALTLAKGEYFVCLNNDATVPKNWLKELEKPFLGNKTAAISGADGSCCILLAEYPSFHGSPGPIYEYVEGSCMCIPTALAREHTLFAPYLHFAYAEDVDLSLRMRARGYTIHPANFRITHERAQTSSKIENIREIQMANHAAMVARWGNYLKFKRFDLPFVIRRTEAIGDVLLTTPLITEIKKQNPQSEIFVETKYPEIFKNNPNVTKVGGPFPEVYKWATLINLDMSYENMTETSIQEGYFKKALIIGKPAAPELYVDPLLAAKMHAYLGDKKWVAVHPGPTNWPGKNWPWKKWELFCQKLLEKSYRVLLVGAKGAALPNYLDLRGHTTFEELGAVMQTCKLFIGVDSFPMHVAQSQGCRVVGLFGTTSPEYILTGDYTAICGTAPCAGERHRIAGKTFTPCDGSCMDTITVEQVLQAI